MDGVLVNSNYYPNGSVNNFDLYKIGVNRAGNSHFEGMIDNLMIWDTALTNSSITVLNRNIINNCTAYSGNGKMLHILKQLTTFQPISQTMLGLSTLMGREVGTYSENMEPKLPLTIQMELN